MQGPLKQLISHFGHSELAAAALQGSAESEEVTHLMALLSAVSEKIRMAESELLAFFFTPPADIRDPARAARLAQHMVVSVLTWH